MACSTLSAVRVSLFRMKCPTVTYVEETQSIGFYQAGEGTILWLHSRLVGGNWNSTNVPPSGDGGNARLPSRRLSRSGGDEPRWSLSVVMHRPGDIDLHSPRRGPVTKHYRVTGSDSIDQIKAKIANVLQLDQGKSVWCKMDKFSWEAQLWHGRASGLARQFTA